MDIQLLLHSLQVAKHSMVYFFVVFYGLIIAFFVYHIIKVLTDDEEGDLLDFNDED